jgi:hypothetical protein
MNSPPLPPDDERAHGSRGEKENRMTKHTWTSLLAAGLLCAVNLSAGAEPRGEMSLRGGGALGTGPLNDYNASLHAMFSFGIPAGDRWVWGLEAGGNLQHVSDIRATGPANPPRYDARINVGLAGVWVKTEVPVYDYLSLFPVVGMGYYQINTFERHAHFRGSQYIGHTNPVPHIATSNHFGTSAGVQLVLKVSEFFHAGPEVRFHQMIGSGRADNPSFVSVALVATVRN